MASSTRPSMLSSPPQKPSPSEADKRRASSSHSHRIASLSARDSFGWATTSLGSAKKDRGCWSIASRSRSEAACIMVHPPDSVCLLQAPEREVHPWRIDVDQRMGRALEIKSRRGWSALGNRLRLVPGTGPLAFACAVHGPPPGDARQLNGSIRQTESGAPASYWTGTGPPTAEFPL